MTLYWYSNLQEDARTLDGNVATAVDLLQNIYQECVHTGSFSCVKPKVLAFLSTSMSNDKIRLTRDLSIVNSESTPPHESTSVLNEVKKNYSKKSNQHPKYTSALLIVHYLYTFQISKVSELNSEKKEQLRLLALDKLDEFLYNHELHIRIPKEILSGDLPAFVPEILTKNLPEELKIPLADGSTGQVQGRSEYYFPHGHRTR